MMCALRLYLVESPSTIWNDPESVLGLLSLMTGEWLSAAMVGHLLHSSAPLLAAEYSLTVMFPRAAATQMGGVWRAATMVVSLHSLALLLASVLRTPRDAAIEFVDATAAALLVLLNPLDFGADGQTGLTGKDSEDTLGKLKSLEVASALEETPQSFSSGHAAQQGWE